MAESKQKKETKEKKPREVGEEKRTEFIARFKEFLRKKYYKDIVKAANEEKALPHPRDERIKRVTRWMSDTPNRRDELVLRRVAEDCAARRREAVEKPDTQEDRQRRPSCPVAKRHRMACAIRQFFPTAAPLQPASPRSWHRTRRGPSSMVHRTWAL